MTLSLTCSCGARLEIDEKFAGQTIRCPDCQQALQAPEAPAAARTPRRTSGFAIASFVLALVGAFTVVGTLLAVVLGAFALVDLRRRPGQVAGRGYAIAGIVLGVALTGLSLFAYLSVELFGLDRLMREPQWAGKLDFGGPLEIVRSKEGYAITRPSEKWGRYRDPQLPQFANWLGEDWLLLVNLDDDGYIVCWPLSVPNQWSVERCREKALDDFRDADLATGPGKTKGNLRASLFNVHPAKHLPTKGDVEAVEMVVDKNLGNQRRTFLVRVVKRERDDQMYLLAGGAPRHRFSRLEPQMRAGLDSFRLLDRHGGRNWP
jgi:hypothetical protein